MKKWIQALIITLALSATAANAIIIEPYLGYETGSAKPDSSASSNSVTGASFGARLGMTTLGFMYGVGYQTGAIKEDVVFKNTDMSIFFGYEFPILVRAYYEYLFSSTSELQDGGFSGYKLTGSGGSKIGVGFTGLPLISINVEMITRKYSKSEVSGTESDYSGDDMTTTMISVSLPLP